MMKWWVILIALFFCFQVNAQYDDETISAPPKKYPYYDLPKPQRNVFGRINFLGFGAGVDAAFGKRKMGAIYFEAGGSFAFRITQITSGSGNTTTDLDIVWFPYIKLRPKYLYNLHKRKSMGKNAERLSSDYVGLHFIGQIPVVSGIGGVRLGPVWGLQRALGRERRGFVDFALGVGVRYEDTGEIFPHLIIDLGLGILF